MSHISEYDFHIVRGTDFSLDVALTEAGFEEVYQQPDLYWGVLTLRAYAALSAPVYLTLHASLEVGETTEAATLMTFSAGPDQTLLLPSYDVEAICTLEARIPGSKDVLFTSHVEVTE